MPDTDQATGLDRLVLLAIQPISVFIFSESTFSAITLLFNCSPIPEIREGQCTISQ
jgi:hypothetical protein